MQVERETYDLTENGLEYGTRITADSGLYILVQSDTGAAFIHKGNDVIMVSNSDEIAAMEMALAFAKVNREKYLERKAENL